jgi:hypothetical protein
MAVSSAPPPMSAALSGSLKLKPTEPISLVTFRMLW